MKRREFVSYMIMTTTLLLIGFSLCFPPFEMGHTGTESISPTLNIEAGVVFLPFEISDFQGDSSTTTPTKSVIAIDSKERLENSEKICTDTSLNTPLELDEVDIGKLVATLVAVSPSEESISTIPAICHAQLGASLECLDVQNLFDRLDKLWKTNGSRLFENAKSQAALSASKSETGSVYWHDDYSRAVREAEGQGKMLLVYFCDPGGNCDCNRFKSETLDNALVCSKLQDYVCLQTPLDASIIVEGKSVVLLKHASFKEMLGKPGIAIIDYRHRDSQVYGTVVSTFPISQRLWYTPEKMAVILDLPAGTLTQRTMIYAVRTHPDKPASTEGEASPYLLEEAQKQSQYQADIRVQGHQFWESRFHRISDRLNGIVDARGLRRELAGREFGRCGHRVRPLLAAFRWALERGSSAPERLRL